MAINQDVFGRTASTFGGAFSADDALMTFPAMQNAAGGAAPALIPLLLQNAGFTYQQQITRLYDLARNQTYYVAGRSQGAGTLSQVLGPIKIANNFLRVYGSVCRAGTNTLHFSVRTGCSDNIGVGITPVSNNRTSYSFSAHYVVLNTIALQMAAENMVIQQNIGMTIGMFSTEDNAGT